MVCVFKSTTKIMLSATLLLILYVAHDRVGVLVEQVRLLLADHLFIN